MSINPMHKAQAAPRCTARSKRTGLPCRAPAVRGCAVCRMKAISTLAATALAFINACQYRRLKHFNVNCFVGATRTARARNKLGRRPHTYPTDHRLRPGPGTDRPTQDYITAKIAGRELSILGGTGPTPERAKRFADGEVWMQNATG
jgi:hypothetical protein